MAAIAEFSLERMCLVGVSDPNTLNNILRGDINFVTNFLNGDASGYVTIEDYALRIARISEIRRQLQLPGVIE